MKVKASPLNTTAGTVFVLKTNENRILHSAPNRWKTKRGAEKWATENGYSLQSAKKSTTKTPCKTPMKAPKKPTPKPVKRTKTTARKK